MSLRKSPHDQALIKQAGGMLHAVLERATALALPGITLLALDQAIHSQILAAGCRPSFLGHEGFPNSACLSLNDQVVHGIPDQRVLKDGDILGIDAGLWLDHVCVDGAVTIAIGNISTEAARLLKGTQRALKAGIKEAKVGARVGKISHAIQCVAEEEGFGIVRALVGHGLGHSVWEPPQVPNFGYPSDGPILKAGQVIAIEPMLTLGTSEVFVEADGWGIFTGDGSLAAQFEHTIIITQQGPLTVT